MLSLDECVKLSKEHERDDFFAIELFLSQNGCTERGVDLLNNILKAKISSLEKWSNEVKSFMIFPNSYYYMDFEYDTAYMLDCFTRKMQMQEELNEEDYELLKNIKIPEKNHGFWHDLAEAIKYAQDNSYKPTYFNYHK